MFVFCFSLATAHERCDAQSYVDSRVSEKILKQAREQLEEEALNEQVGDSYQLQVQQQLPAAPVTFAALRALARGDDGDDDEDNDSANEVISDNEIDEDKDYFEELEIDAEDEAAVAAFLNLGPPGTRNLADIVMAKIREAEAGITPAAAAEMMEARFHPKVLEVYRGVGAILSRYHSGKLPKPFKIIPSVNNWEELVYLTKPEKWTPAATYHATVIFSSNLSPAVSESENTFVPPYFFIYPLLRWRNDSII